MSEAKVAAYVDSDGDLVVNGDTVHVAFHVAKDMFNKDGREFDFGVVAGLNSDGTVNVVWDESRRGCGCSLNEDEESEVGRVENTEDLTVSTPDVRDGYRLGYERGVDDGWDEGHKEAVESFQDLFGIRQLVTEVVKVALENQ